MKKLIAGMIVATVTLLGAGRAHADVAAIYAEGHGGMESGGSGSNASGNEGSMPGLGFQLGARLLIFEGYLDHTSFGDGAAVSRGIFGLRAGLGLGPLRLVLRGGAGAIQEQGGALTGRNRGTPERVGAVGRIGVALESRIAPTLLAGFAIDGETFALPAAGGLVSSGAVQGSDVFASLHLTFELGI